MINFRDCWEEHDTSTTRSFRDDWLLWYDGHRAPLPLNRLDFPGKHFEKQPIVKLGDLWRMSAANSRRNRIKAR